MNVRAHPEERSRLRPLGLVALFGATGLFIVGLDQGQLLSVVQGASAFETNWIHEFVHDARHLAGFPCH